MWLRVAIFKLIFPFTVRLRSQHCTVLKNSYVRDQVVKTGLPGLTVCHSQPKIPYTKITLFFFKKKHHDDAPKKKEAYKLKAKKLIKIAG